MSAERVKDILDRVLTWPKDRQEDAASMLALMEAQNQAAYHLTDEHVEEVKRRLRNPDRRTLSLEEVSERLRHLLDE